MVRAKKIGALSIKIWCHSPLTYSGTFSDSWNRKNQWRERIPNQRNRVQNWRELILRSENKIRMKIPEFKRSGIGLIVEFHGIPNGFPNQEADNSGSTTNGGRGFIVRAMISQHYVAKVGCSLYNGIDLASVNFCSDIFSCSLCPTKDHHCWTTRWIYADGCCIVAASFSESHARHCQQCNGRGRQQVLEWGNMPNCCFWAVVGCCIP